MRTDLKLNYNVLDSISGKLSRCYTAIENMQVELANLEELLEEQDSQAYETEAKKIQSTNMFFGKRKTTIKMLRKSVDDYIADMEEKVGATNRYQSQFDCSCRQAGYMV